jgi:hypothetical protein
MNSRCPLARKRIVERRPDGLGLPIGLRDACWIRQRDVVKSPVG